MLNGAASATVTALTPTPQMTRLSIMPRLISCVVYPSSFRELIQVTGASLPSMVDGTSFRIDLDLPGRCPSYHPIGKRLVQQTIQ
jgi:hypothetical protein